MMRAKNFSRKIEDFECENCGQFVTGDGYTNHCPSCLWSKHVDVNPGDRSADCGGLMEPIGVLTKGDEYVIVHECQICGHRKNNHTSQVDDMNVVIELSTRPVR